MGVSSLKSVLARQHFVIYRLHFSGLVRYITMVVAISGITMQPGRHTQCGRSGEVNMTYTIALAAGPRHELCRDRRG